jgi:hypothetical protein
MILGYLAAAIFSIYTISWGIMSILSLFGQKTMKERVLGGFMVCIGILAGPVLFWGMAFYIFTHFRFPA